MKKKPTYEELQQRIEELEKQSELQFKVSTKGAVSVYGLGRFPVTLYYEQWTRLLAAGPELSNFLQVNSGKLKRK